MNDFVYKNPTKLVFGMNTVQRIGEEVKNIEVNSVLLLYDKGSIYKNGVYDTIVRALKESEIEYIELSGVRDNPVLSKVYEAIDIIKKENLQGIVASGGGSVIDTAKAAAAGVKYDGDVWDIFEGKGQVEETIPIFTVLTISGDGSELNSRCTITKEEENKRHFLSSEYIYPVASIVDPTVQFTLSKEQTINGAIEAMSNMFELYFDGTKNTDVLDEFSEGIIRTIMRHVQVLINQPDNYDSRAELALCAALALNGYNALGRNGGDWVPHQIQHSLSAFYHITLGEGLAIVFPNWMKYVYKYDIRKFVRFADRVFGIKQGTEDERVLKAIDLLRDFYRSLGAPISLKEVGVRYEDLDKLADNAVELGNPGTLKVLDKEDVLQIYKLSYE
jgi:alcohol dehydrogenase YqhD (iron-dependent ADH family)